MIMKNYPSTKNFLKSIALCKLFAKEKSPPFFFLLIVFIILELAVSSQLIHRQIIPAPSDVIRLLFIDDISFFHEFTQTLKNSLLGFLASSTLGLVTAFVFYLSPLFRRSLEPLSVFFQTVPIVAIAPLLVIYFGYGDVTVQSSSFIVSFFPILANTLSGFSLPRPQEVELFKIYKATEWKILWKLRLPRAFESIFVGLKISSGLALIGTVAGEFVAGGGLGSLIDSARTQQRVDIVYASLCLLSVLGLLYIYSLEVIKLIILRLRPFREIELSKT